MPDLPREQSQMCPCDETREMALWPEDAGAAEARDLTRRVLQSRPDGRTTACGTGDVVLAVSELVGNAFNHGRQPVRVRIRAVECGLLAEVYDASPRPARLRAPSSDGSGGYGLHIVDALADRWGNEPTAAGKTVWALFRWQPPRPVRSAGQRARPGSAGGGSAACSRRPGGRPPA